MTRSSTHLLIGLLSILSLSGLIANYRLGQTNKSLSALLAKTEGVSSAVFEIKNLPNQNGEVATALANLREELVRYRAEQVGRDQILGLSDTPQAPDTDTYSDLSLSLDQALAIIEKQTNPTPTSNTTQKIKLLEKWSRVDAYEQPKAGSAILGQLTNDKQYPLLDKLSGWYQIKLTNQAAAWVQAQFVYETTN